jgi:hypothetical protein
MIKNYTFRISLLLAALFAMSSCSSDDGAKDCDSCTLQGKKLELCDNGNGTYTLSYDGKSETVNEAELEDLTPKEFVDFVCALGNIEDL